MMTHTHTHSRHWNSHYIQRRNVGFIEDFIDIHELKILKIDTATRPSDGIHSIIDLTLATPSTQSHVAGWRVVDDPTHATGSDPEIIEWSWIGRAPVLTWAS